MTVSATYAPPQYQGNGATTSFAFPFQFFAPSDLVVNLFDTGANVNVTPQPAAAPTTTPSSAAPIPTPGNTRTAPSSSTMRRSAITG